MNAKEQQELKAALSGMDRAEIRKLYQQANSVRKNRLGRKENKPIPLDEVVFELLKSEAPRRAFGQQLPGLVVWNGRKSCTVRTEEGDIEADLDGHRPAVGDTCQIGRLGKAWLVAKIEPRRTKLSRPDVDNANHEKVIVANVDTVVIAVSVGSPPLHPRLIDRYLITIERGGAEPLICVNKCDLLVDPAELDVLEPYSRLGVPIVKCTTLPLAPPGERELRDEGLEALRARLLGKTCAFVGHSGVGKSSLVNALYPDLNQLVGNVSAVYGRGTHTTTATSLFDVGGGTRLIDTPGIRSLGLWKMEPHELAWYFPEFEGIRCKFRDCIHDSEPGCAIKAAVEEGAIHGARYDTYLRLLRGQ